MTFTYATPAFVQDLQSNPAAQAALNALWNTNLTGWVAQAMPSAPSWFYDPATTAIPSGAGSALIQWNAFPGRVTQFYSSSPPVNPIGPYGLTQLQLFELVDTGYYTPTGGGSRRSFQPIPAALCPQADWSGTLKTFGPYGPRGWLDEYCEWSVARDSSGNIIRIDFTCENPEYWTSLWMIDANAVAALYTATLNAGAPASRQVTVTVDDLTMRNSSGSVVTYPDGTPAYNPLNKWNSGPNAVRVGSAGGFSGGAMHLTSTPNTLQTEIGLAGQATIAWASGNANTQQLICCGNFGQEYRHSDPTIGQSVSQAVSPNPPTGNYNTANLANPFGLYIQMPSNFGNWSFGERIQPGKNGIPANAQPSDIWQIVRGAQAVTDPVTGQPFPGAMIMHVACQIPASWLAADPSLTLSDIEINYNPIRWAGQIATSFNMGLYARPLSGAATPSAVPCASGITAPNVPQQCLYASLWNGYNSLTENAPTGATMSMASNTTFIAPQLKPGALAVPLVVTCTTFDAGSRIQFVKADGSVDPAFFIVVQGAESANYAVPGNSYPSACQAVHFTVTVSMGAAAGFRGIQIVPQSGSPNVLPAAINVVA